MESGPVLAAVVVAVMAVAVAAVGIRVGMLLAPRVERWGTPRDESEDGSADDHR
jgi:hypothetical protein